MAWLRRSARTCFLTAALLAGSMIGPVRAGAEASDLGWWLTAYGSAHCTLDLADGYHVVCARYNAAGTFNGWPVNDWLPGFCQFSGSTQGNAAGTPLQLRFQSSDPNRGCIPADGAWGDGSGNAEGVMAHDPNYVTTRTGQVFGRDPSAWWAYSTIAEVW